VNGYYTLVLNQADYMEKNFPNSPYLQDAYRYRAESYYFLGMPGRALENLEKCRKHADVDYLYGRIYFDGKDYQKAASFFKASLSAKEQSEKFYSTELYYGESLYLLKEYEKSAGYLLRLISQKGYSFQGGKASCLLCQDFYELNRQDRICQVYEKILPIIDKLDSDYSKDILLMSAISYDRQQQKDKAKSLYEELMQESDGEIAGLSEFWLRMACESYAKSEYVNAMRYLKISEENLNKSEKSEGKLTSLIILYKAALSEKDGDLKSAISLLEDNLANSKSYTKDYLIFLTDFSYKNKDYKKVLAYGQKIYDLKSQEKSEEENLALFYYAKALENAGQKEKADSVIQNIDSQSLWARSQKALARQEKDPAEFQQIYQDNKSSKIAYENYVIELLRNSQTSFLSDINLSQLEDASYYQGLAYYLNASWTNSSFYLHKYIEENADKSQKAKNILDAKYYYAFAQFQLLKNENACQYFIEYAEEAESKNLKYKAWFNASQCSLSLYGEKKDKAYLEKAIFCMEKALECDIPLKTKMEAVYSLTQFYISNGEIDKAENLLLTYSQGTSAEEIELRFRLADLYAGIDKLTQAEKVYNSIVTSSQDKEIREKASYLKAYMYYDKEFWDQTISLFAKYRRDYPDGIYFGKACYYNSLCLVRLENTNLALVLLQEALESKLEAQEEFSVMYELMKIYRNKGDYEKAINIARKILKQFPEQSREEKISRQIHEISFLASGETDRCAVLLTDYLQNGMMSTKEGRKAGFELAKRYLLIEAKKSEGKKLLQDFVNSPELDITVESQELAQAYFLYATSLREDFNYEECSKNFLKAAQLYASFDKEQAAKSMYGAIEAFDCNGKFADAKSTYKALLELYPDSVWIMHSKAIVKDYL
ncbi:MAG: tetratricopeptide repeat protein, partial [Treponemataceae bacterium]|nr:tetratricopeptide repeat protein [Treponemataceae bacterium]